MNPFLVRDLGRVIHGQRVAEGLRAAQLRYATQRDGWSRPVVARILGLLSLYRQQSYRPVKGDA